jgi:glycerol-3-phosphate cytidylyltransferase
MCDTFILLKYIKDNNIKKITVNADVDEINNSDNNTPDKDNYYSMICFKDLRIFAPHIITEIYISKKIENPQYIDALKYTTNMFCKNKETYKYYSKMKTAESVSSQHIGHHFPNLFYIKFHKCSVIGKQVDETDTPIFIQDKYDKGITFGTFDLFHYGHNNILTRCKHFCNYLYIGLSSDELNAKKGKNSIDDYEKRKEVIRNANYGDEIFKEESLELKNDYVLQTGAKILMMGDDWLGEFDWVSCDVLYMERTPNISTTLLKTIRNMTHNDP